MGPQPVSLGGASPGAQSTTSTRSEEATPQPILVTEDVEDSEEINQTMPELYMASLAGSFKEGKPRCIIDLAETFPDRPVGMYDAARGQCRSLSEDPSGRRTVGRRSKSGSRTLQSIQEDSELGDDIPVAHALFLPTNEQLPSAPFPFLGSGVRPTSSLRFASKEWRACTRACLVPRQVSLDSERSQCLKNGCAVARFQERGMERIRFGPFGNLKQKLASAVAVRLPLAHYSY